MIEILPPAVDLIFPKKYSIALELPVPFKVIFPEAEVILKMSVDPVPKRIP